MYEEKVKRIGIFVFYLLEPGGIRSDTSMISKLAVADHRRKKKIVV